MRFLTLFLSSLLLGACSKQSPPPTPPPTPVTKPATPPVAAPPPPVQPIREEAVGPQASLSVNGSVQPVSFRGWPLRAVLDDPYPTSSQAPALETVGQSWPWLAVPGAWLLTGEQTATIAVGKYRIRAAGAEIELDLRDEPAELSADQKRKKLIGQAQAMIATGRAEALLEIVRAAPPDSTSAMIEGDAFLALGKKTDAAIHYRAALARFRSERPNAYDAPFMLLHRLAAAERE